MDVLFAWLPSPIKDPIGALLVHLGGFPVETALNLWLAVLIFNALAAVIRGARRLKASSWVIPGLALALYFLSAGAVLLFMSDGSGSAEVRGVASLLMQAGFVLSIVGVFRSFAKD